MKQRLLFVFCLILVSSLPAFSQARTVTNADLDKYRQERLRAEAEYRENYKKLGLPSPEELDHRREQSRVETERILAQLRAEQLERDRLETERQLSEQRTSYVYVESGLPFYNDQVFFSSFARGRGRPIRQGFTQQGYFAGGQFWPTGSRTPSRPLWVPHR